MAKAKTSKTDKPEGEAESTTAVSEVPQVAPAGRRLGRRLVRRRLVDDRVDAATATADEGTKSESDEGANG